MTGEQVRRLVEIMSERLPEALKGLMPKMTKRFFDLELGPPHVHTLELLSKLKSLPKISEISRELSISLAMMTRIIDRLESKQLVSRISDRSDRRVIRVKLTPRGKATLRKIRHFQTNHMITLLSRFEEKDREAFTEAMEVVLNILLKYRRRE